MHQSKMQSNEPACESGACVILQYASVTCQQQLGHAGSLAVEHTQKEEPSDAEISAGLCPRVDIAQADFHVPLHLCKEPQVRLCQYRTRNDTLEHYCC